MTVHAVRRWLTDHTSLEPSLLDGAGFEALVKDRLLAHGGDERTLIAALSRSSDEVDRLVAGIAVPETWLFRYPRSYELLVEYLERRLATGATSVRLLSIGCASGQEPYCMAMAALHAGWPAERVSVAGIDGNAECLRHAAAAEYGASSIRSEVPAWAVRYLQHAGQTTRIDPAVRALVRFSRVDATDPEALAAFGPCDVVFSRNLFIYLNAAARERLIDSISNILVPGGMLFMGHAEQAMRTSPLLRAVATPHAFAFERLSAPSSTPISPPVAARPASASARPSRHQAARPASDSRAAPSADAGPPPEETIERARELADAGRAMDGEAMLRRIMVRSGPSARAFELLGMIRMAANDVQNAKPLFERAVYLDPASPASLLQLAIISERSGDPRRAAMLWDRARRTDARGEQERRA